jgi:hypothetical protein
MSLRAVVLRASSVSVAVSDDVTDVLLVGAPVQVLEAAVSSDTVVVQRFHAFGAWPYERFEYQPVYVRGVRNTVA